MCQNTNLFMKRFPTLMALRCPHVPCIAGQKACLHTNIRSCSPHALRTCSDSLRSYI